MSWDVYLGSGVKVDQHEDGGTYVLGGTDRAELNVTYNYGQVYREAIGHNLIDWLDGERAGDTITLLREVVDNLGTERDDDYWAPTPGNAGYAASILLRWAEQHPDEAWAVS